jgi:hypothetical protein
MTAQEAPMRIAVALAIALAAPDAAAQLYKCTQDGKVVYQDSPCAAGSQQGTVRQRGGGTPTEAAPEPPAATGAARPAAPSAPLPPELRNVVAVLSGHNACAAQVEGYAARYSVAFQEWGARNQAAIRRYNEDLDAQDQVRIATQRAQSGRPTDPEAMAQRAQACDQDAQRWFAPAQ